MSVTRSHEVCPATPSTSASTRSRILSVRSATRRGVKPALTSLRSRVWSGGSLLIRSSESPAASSSSLTSIIGCGELRNVPEVARHPDDIRVAHHGPVAARPDRVVVMRDRLVPAEVSEHLVGEAVRVGGRVVQREGRRLHAQSLPRPPGTGDVVGRAYDRRHGDPGRVGGVRPRGCGGTPCRDRAQQGRRRAGAGDRRGAVEPRRSGDPEAARLRHLGADMRSRGRPGRGHVRHPLPPRRAAGRTGTRRLRAPAGVDSGDRRGVARVTARAARALRAGRRAPRHRDRAGGRVPRAPRGLARGPRRNRREPAPRAADVVRLHLATRQRLEPDWYDEQDLMRTAAQAVGTDASVAHELGTSVLYLPQRLSRHMLLLLDAIASASAITVLAGTTGAPRADADVLAAVRSLDRRRCPSRRSALRSRLSQPIAPRSCWSRIPTRKSAPPYGG